MLISEKSQAAFDDDDSSVRISNIDRLRFIETMLDDDVIVYYKNSQNVMTRGELDGRNSTEREPTFYEKCAEKFNDSSYLPFSTPYPTLHPDFKDAIPLKKGNYEMTAEKCKYLIDKTKPLLKSMICRYEISGNGCMSRHDKSAGWGKFNIE